MHRERLTRTQKDDVNQFRRVTKASEKTAVDYLRREGWNLQNSIDAYYTNPPPRLSTKSDKRMLDAIEKLWAQYKDPREEMMRAAGVGQFLDDLRVEPTDVAILVLCYHFDARVMSEFRKSEFVGGLAKLGCDSLENLRQRLPELRAELDDNDTFRKVYEFAYGFSTKQGTKIVEQNMAIAMWGLLFMGNRSWELLQDWCDFLQEKHNRPILKDTWLMLLDFVQTTKSDFSNYDPLADAWPPLIDEFVDHICKKRGQPSPMDVKV